MGSPREAGWKKPASEFWRDQGVRCKFMAAALTDPEAPAEVLAFSLDKKMGIWVLINNAGLSRNCRFADTPRQGLADKI